MSTFNAVKENKAADEKEEIANEENYRLRTHHVEPVVDPHCAPFEAFKHFEGVLLVFVRDVRVGKLGEEGLLGWDPLLTHLLPATNVIVWIHPLATELPHI